jgi:hypothetical protein
MTKLMLSAGHVTPDSPISVQLINNRHPQARPTVTIVWPSHITQCSPPKLSDVINTACRILTNANLELARIQAADRRR